MRTLLQAFPHGMEGPRRENSLPLNPHYNNGVSNLILFQTGVCVQRIWIGNGNAKVFPPGVIERIFGTSAPTAIDGDHMGGVVYHIAVALHDARAGVFAADQYFAFGLRKNFPVTLLFRRRPVFCLRGVGDNAHKAHWHMQDTAEVDHKLCADHVHAARHPAQEGITAELDGLGKDFFGQLLFEHDALRKFLVLQERELVRAWAGEAAGSFFAHLVTSGFGLLDISHSVP